MTQKITYSCNLKINNDHAFTLNYMYTFFLLKLSSNVFIFIGFLLVII